MRAEEIIGKLNTELELLANKLSQPGISILIAQVEKPEHQETLALELQRRLKSEVERWLFSPEQLNLPGYILSSEGKRTIFAFGLEGLDSSARKEVYRILNLGREKIGRSGCSLLLWLPGQLINELMRYAPDFWAWVQGVHPLTLPDDEVEKQKVLIALRLWGVETLDQLRQRYLEYIVNSYRRLDFRGIIQVRNIVRFPLDRLFVPLVGVKRNREPKVIPFEEHRVPLEEAWKVYRLLVILGNPGSGKSTFLKHLALTFAMGMREEERTPILFSIAEYSMARRTRNLTLLEFIAWRFQQEGLPDFTGLFLSELEKGKAIVLLDGLDEVLTRGEREDIARAMENLAKRYPLSRFIVISRIASYDTALLPPDFTIITIAPFEREQIESFAKNWAMSYEGTALEDKLPPELEKRARRRAEDMIQAVTSHPAIERLATNPLLLTILALIHHQGTRLPQQRVELYRLCLEALAETWNLARSLS
ncbi:MAG: NACHT domain-containing protein, partial [Anaerolineae bacterium]|nr:NACHT domain-containing protein [Anaerolineae bacterium]